MRSFLEDVFFKLRSKLIYKKVPYSLDLIPLFRSIRDVPNLTPCLPDTRLHKGKITRDFQLVGEHVDVACKRPVDPANRLVDFAQCNALSFRFLSFYDGSHLCIMDTNPT